MNIFTTHFKETKGFLSVARFASAGNETEEQPQGGLYTLSTLTFEEANS